MADTNDILERYGLAKSKRDETTGVLEEIGRYVWPASQDMNNVVNQPDGQTRTQPIYDSTAITSALRMTSGIFSFLMPVGVQWFEFVAEDVEDKKNSSITLWLSNGSQAEQSEIWRSNFQRQMFSTVRSMVVFGTGVISVEMDSETREIVFRSYHFGDVFYEENHKGVIDTVFRRIRYTVRQAVLEFGIENVGEAVRSDFKSKKLNSVHEYIHAVLPQVDRDVNKLDASGKKFISSYIEVDSKKEVKSGGFDEMPYLIGRLDIAPNEIIGRSPSFDLLPEIRMLNDMKLTFIEGAENAISPTLMVWDDSVVGQPITGPRGILNLRPDAPEPKPLNTGFNPALGDIMIEKQQKIIKDGYFNDLFDALDGLRNISSATEADIRQQSKLNILAPMVNSLQKELFDPLLTRVFNLLLADKTKNVIPPPPKDFDYDIVYRGRLAVAMATLQAAATETHLAKWAPLEDSSAVFDNMDLDDAFRRTGLDSGVPGDLFRTEEEVIAIRQERNQSEQMQQQAEIAATAAKAYKDSTTPIQPNSLAEAL